MIFPPFTINAQLALVSAYPRLHLMIRSPFSTMTVRTPERERIPFAQFSIMRLPFFSARIFLFPLTASISRSARVEIFLFPELRILRLISAVLAVDEVFVVVVVVPSPLILSENPERNTARALVDWRYDAKLLLTVLDVAPTRAPETCVLRETSGISSCVDSLMFLRLIFPSSPIELVAKNASFRVEYHPAGLLYDCAHRKSVTLFGAVELYPEYPVADVFI